MSVNSEILELDNTEALVWLQFLETNRPIVKKINRSQIDELGQLLMQEVEEMKILCGELIASDIEPIIKGSNILKKKLVKFPYKAKAMLDTATGALKFSQEDEKKVLIVDDSKTIRKLLEKIISNIPGFTVADSVESADAARKSIQNEAPDIITLDVHMPGMNGVDFLKTYLKTREYLQY